MDKLVIDGGVRLTGEVEVSGSKNAGLPLIFSSILSDKKFTLKRLPALNDIKTTFRLLRHMGVGIEEEAGGRVAHLTAPDTMSKEAPYELVKTMRASVLALGPLIARFGYAKVSLPGGCAIGARPIDLHLKALKLMGAQLSLDGGYVIARAKRLTGAKIYFDISTVTGTENIMMAAVLAKGETVLQNAAKEPEVACLAEMLNRRGAKITGYGTDVITIQGVDALCEHSHRVSADRIEAGTYMVAAAITGGDVILKNCPVEDMGALVSKLRQAGVTVDEGDDTVRVIGPEELVSVSVKTGPFPEFPTDMQAQFMSLMTVATGTSVISENIFENRFMHVNELTRMGADITIEGHSAVVKGVRRLSAAPVMATDLRASASLVVAALRATGRSEIKRIYHLDRGYERMEEKLVKLGAKIERQKDE